MTGLIHTLFRIMVAISNKKNKKILVLLLSLSQTLAAAAVNNEHYHTTYWCGCLLFTSITISWLK